MSTEIVSGITIADIERFIYIEAGLLDEWRLDDWLELLTDDASYSVPANDRPNGDPNQTLFLINDDIRRIRARVKRLKSRNAHAENPRSRTRRMVNNIRVTEVSGDHIHVTANFIVYRFRRHFPDRVYVGKYDYKMVVNNGQIKIADRKATLDSEELGAMGSVSILL